MSQLLEFLNNEDWDAPFFKRLAHNDTGQARGHQGGIVVPKDLRKFFPTLDHELITAANPTTDRSLRAEMYVGIIRVGEAVVRYQIQTWGGTRTPEGRITENLRPIWDQASAGDVLVVQRAADSLDRFRFILVKARSVGFTSILNLTGERRWGSLYLDREPVTHSDLIIAEQELVTLANQPFELMQTEVRRVDTRQSRIARSAVFPKLISREYGDRCSVSGFRISTPSLLYEVQAAHVVPISQGGVDDVRNGLALTHTLHWAFDNGLFGIRPDRRVYVPPQVRDMEGNGFLLQFEGRRIAEANSQQFRVHDDALAWHLRNRVGKWA